LLLLSLIDGRTKGALFICDYRRKTRNDSELQFFIRYAERPVI